MQIIQTDKAEVSKTLRCKISTDKLSLHTQKLRRQTCDCVWVEVPRLLGDIENIWDEGTDP